MRRRLWFSLPPGWGLGVITTPLEEEEEEEGGRRKKNE
jgi:hypothetical protein